ncbi:MAG: PLP-dependent aminotransferase family protein [Cereibacter changlensis]
MANWMPTLAANGKPRYIEIADVIAQDIRRGALSSGDRLPPQRKLAEQLGLDFTTISRAYAEAARRGLVESHVGRGTFVRRAASAPAPAAPGPAAEQRRAVEQDLSMNLPPEPDDPALMAEMAAGLAALGPDLVALLRYQATTGSPHDREVARGWLARRGIAAGLDQLAITPGAHATMLAILSNIACPGDRILCEAVTYPGIRSLCARLGLVLIGVAEDAEGVLPEALDEAIRQHAPKALYLNPTLHNPTTRSLPAERRRQIAEVLARRRLALIEDDAYGFLRQPAVPGFAELLPGLVWHVAGLSKCIGAGLRLAFTVAPDSRSASLLAQTLRTTSIMASPLSMALVTRWIEAGTADRICAFVRAESAARQAIAAEVLQGFHFDSDPQAFSVWLHLPSGLARADVMGRMSGRGIGLMPADAFTVLGSPTESLRVCLGGPIRRDRLRDELMALTNALTRESWLG